MSCEAPQQPPHSHTGATPWQKSCYFFGGNEICKFKTAGEHIFEKNITCILYIRFFFVKELGLHVLVSAPWFSLATATTANFPGFQMQQRSVLLLSAVCMMLPRRGRYVCPSIFLSSSSLGNRSNLVLASSPLAASNSPGTQVYHLNTLTQSAV